MSFGVGAAVSTGDRAPRFEVADTDYGVRHRRAPDEPGRPLVLARHPVPAAVLHDAAHRSSTRSIVQSHIWVPMDDTHVVNWMVTWHPERPLTDEEIRLHVEGKGAHVCDYAPATSEPYGDVRTAANRDNDYFMDWEVAPHADVLRHPRLRRAGPGRAGEPGRRIVDRTPGAPRARATPRSSRCASA